MVESENGEPGLGALDSVAGFRVFQGRIRKPVAFSAIISLLLIEVILHYMTAVRQVLSSRSGIHPGVYGLNAINSEVASSW